MTKPVQALKTEVPPRRTQAGGDWLAWFVPLLFGMTIGALAGCWLFTEMFRFHSVDLGQMALVIGGGSLCGGGFSLCRGKSGWMAPSPFMPAEPAPGRFRRKCGMLLGVIGVQLVFLAIGLFHMSGTDSFLHSSSMDWGFKLFFLPFWVILVWLTIKSLRTGRVSWRSRNVDREETPLLFWLYMVLASGPLILLTIALFS